jgi:hypothetical protein
MRRCWIAVRAFFAVLFNGQTAARVEQSLLGSGGDAPPPDRPSQQAAPQQRKAEVKTPPAPTKPAPAKASRSDALTLLATLQREARFVDFLQEALDEYTDDQVGAAVRDVHRQCRQVLERMFALRPLVRDNEGAAIEVPAGFEAGKYRLTGNVSGQAPFRGQLAHHGWEAAKCELPSWTGGEGSAMVVAPAEVEVKS